MKHLSEVTLREIIEIAEGWLLLAHQCGQSHNAQEAKIYNTNIGTIYNAHQGLNHDAQMGPNHNTQMGLPNNAHRVIQSRPCIGTLRDDRCCFQDVRNYTSSLDKFLAIYIRVRRAFLGCTKSAEPLRKFALCCCGGDIFLVRKTPPVLIVRKRSMAHTYCV